MIIRRERNARAWNRRREAEQARAKLAEALQKEASVIGKDRPNRATLAAAGEYSLVSVTGAVLVGMATPLARMT